MLFNSLDFIIFFPLVTLLYYFVPKRFQSFGLLVASYYFYMCWNVKYVVLLLFSTVLTYIAAILIERYTECKRLILLVCVILSLGLLVYFKYTNFLIEMVCRGLSIFGVDIVVPKFDILLPVGISFYIFQAIGYTTDVYKGKIKPERNFFQYALFVSFFPQLVAGPIERSENLLYQLKTTKNFRYANLREGFIVIIYGFFMKIVVADRCALFVDYVYDNYEGCTGWQLAIASLLFAIQIYCDFCGYSTIALGTAKILGINLMENFNAPYFSFSVSDFWSKWHISLTSWFRDYLYIPLGGNRKGLLRKWFNKMIVFLLSGAWHGAGLTYIVWGGINGLYQVLEEAVRIILNRFGLLNKLRRSMFKIFMLPISFLLVDISWIFFRSQTIESAIYILRAVLNTRITRSIILDTNQYECGMSIVEFICLIMSIILMMIIDLFKHNNIDLKGIVLKQNSITSGIIVGLLLLLVLVLGIYGPAYDKNAFIYFQF